MRRIGVRLRKWRESTGMSQMALSRRIGMEIKPVRVMYWDQGTISRIELGVVPPPSPDDPDGTALYRVLARLMDEDEKEIVGGVRHELRLRAIDGLDVRAMMAERLEEAPELLKRPDVKEILSEAVRRLAAALDELGLKPPRVDETRTDGEQAYAGLLDALEGADVTWGQPGYLPSGRRPPRKRGSAAGSHLGEPSWWRYAAHLVNATCAREDDQASRAGSRWRRAVLRLASPADATDLMLVLASEVRLTRTGLSVKWRDWMGREALEALAERENGKGGGGHETAVLLRRGDTWELQWIETREPDPGPLERLAREGDVKLAPADLRKPRYGLPAEVRL